MKKLFCLGLILFMLTAAFSACADADLDALFSSGTLTLAEVFGPTDLDLPEEIKEDPSLWSLSPVGYSAILTAGKSMLTVYDEKVSVVHPSAERGVKDEYGNLERYYSTLTSTPGNLVGEEGVVYSPDGRYAFIGNKDYTLMYMKLFVDPILLDLTTGELILTATYPDKMGLEGIGAVTAGVFSADGNSFYYLVYGKTARLCRYDLNTDETEICLESDLRLYFPRLSELPDGSLLMLSDSLSTRDDDAQGFAIASRGSEGWSLREIRMPLENAFCHANLLTCSAGGLVCMTVSSARPLAFQLINPEKDFEGLDRLLCVTKDTDELVSLSPEEYMNAVQGEELPYQQILKTVFSPDGRYLLLHTRDKMAYRETLLLIRLEDMAVVKPGGLEAEDILSGPLAKAYPVCIEWNTQALLIGTKTGVRAYCFE